MSAGRPKERPRLIPSHDSSHSNAPPLPNTSGRLGAFSSSYQGETFSQQPYGLMQPKPRGIAYELPQSASGRFAQEAYERGRLSGPSPGQSRPQASPHPLDRLDVHHQRERLHPSPFSDKMDAGLDKRSLALRPPPMEHNIMSAVPPKKARYHEASRMVPGATAWSQPLRIDTSLDANKMKMEPLGGYHPETEAISPTLPTESHDSKSDIVHSINEVDRELNLIENQIQQLQKKQLKLEAEAAKPKEDIPEDDSTESKPLSIAQIVYKENRRHAHKSHDLLSKLKYTDPSASADLPLFHQPCDTQVYHENVQKFATFKSLLQSYFKKKTLERSRTERYWADNYERLVTNWLKKVDAKTIKKNIKDIKTREYYEKVFPEIKKHREDKERITSRVGARGVSSGYARTEAEFEQIVDGITEQEEEDKKMRAYAIIPPMLNQTQRKLKFINRNGLIAEPMSEYKERKETTNWSTDEKEIFKEKYLERPKQFGQIAEILEKKTLNDCVLYYYMSKKTENFKQLLKKQVKRPPRRPPMKSSIRTSNEGQAGTTSEGTNCGLTNCDTNEQDVVRVTRPPSEDLKQSCCAACGKKLESYSVSHTVTKNNCSQFGLDPEEFQSDWRVCATCAKHRRKKTKICPIPTCSSPHRRIRHLPVHWDQIPTLIKEKIRNELQMDEDVKRCCSACYDKVADLLLDGDNDVDDTSHEGGYAAKWCADDINTFKGGIQQYGKQWPSIASLIDGKTQDQCRMYFYRNKKRLGLDVIYSDYRKRKMEEGFDIEPSDDSADEDDDNIEDNDMSSDNENSGLASFPLNTVMSKVEPTSTATPSAVKNENTPDTKPEVSNPVAPTTRMVNGNINVAENLTSMKSEESLDMPKLLIKPEKMEYDSSATASADEDHAGNPHFLEERPSDDKSLNPLSKAMSFVKQEPGLMNNPDGMIPTASSIQQRPPNSQANTPSTSVKDLIDLAIEDALCGSTSADDVSNPAVSQRQSVISQCPPHNSPALQNAMHAKVNSQQPQDMRVDMHSQAQNMSGAGSSRPPSQNRPAVMDDSLARRQTPLLPYESDPRAYIQATKEKQQLGQHKYHVPGAIDSSGSVRAPPPAHSHHLTPAAMDKRNTDRKSPAPFALYDGKAAGSDNGVSPHARQTIGQPPPLISSGGVVPHLPPHMAQQIKKEVSHAGGSILQGTSASHSQQPIRFDAGSISHGTPRNQQEVKPVNQPPRSNDDLTSRSPRSQPPMHSPAMPGQPAHIEKLFEQQQQHQQMMYLQMEAMRRGSLAPGLAQLPAQLAFDPYHGMKSVPEQHQTKSVLQSDYFTAKQMSSNSVSMPIGASAYSSALDKSGKASPQAAALMAAGLAPGLMEQQMLMFMNNHRMISPRMVAPDRARLLGSTNLPNSTAITKDEVAKPFALVNKQAQVSRPEPPRVQKPSMIPKTVEMLQRPNESNRRSASPHTKRDKTRYEKDMEEMKYRSLSDRNQQESGSYSRKPQMGYNNMMSGMKHEEMQREKTNDNRERAAAAADYRDRMMSQFPRSPYSVADDPVHNSQTEADKRQEVTEQMNPYSRVTDTRRSPGMKQTDETAFVCKKLLEVSKVIEKEQLHKDASSLFSSSFEKDSHLQRPKYVGEEPRTGLTTANIIDAIITKQINNENSVDNANKLAAAAASSASHQHTSVIVPPKKQQRPIQHSHSDTDISNYSMSAVSNGETTGTSSAPPLPSGGIRGAAGSHITLADKINEIITNDYNAPKTSEHSEGHAVGQYHQRLDRPASNSSTLQRYRVEDVEPISPPNSNGSQSRNSKYSGAQSNAAKSNMVGGKKHAGIRSLLGADNPNFSESGKLTVSEMSPITTSGITLMEVLKSNIEEAIRQDSDLSVATAPTVSPANGQVKHGLYGTTQLPYSKADDRLSESGIHRDGSKKRSLQAMLAPSSKRTALSPRRAKSPEEVDMYPPNSNSSPATSHGAGPMYRTPPSSNAFPMYRPMNPGRYPHPAYFNAPNTASKLSPHMTSGAAASRPGPGNPSIGGSLPNLPNSLAVTTAAYQQQRNSIMNSSYPQNLSSGHSSSTDELVIDEGSMELSSHPKHSSNTSHSPARSTMRSPGVAGPNANRMSPVAGYHNNSAAYSNNRVSPVGTAAGGSRTSPLTNSQTSVRKSPISGATSNNRMSPGVYGPSQTNVSRPSSRQSPALTNRQSPIISRHSPMDSMARSPLTAAESPTSRMNHFNSDLSRHNILSENNIHHSLPPKTLEAARSLHSLGTMQSRPLLSERYETLSDDDR